MVQSVDLLDELITARKKNGDEVVAFAHQVLKNEVQREQEIRHRLDQVSGHHWDVDVEALDQSRIFELRDIHKICVKFRLRFLDTSMFIGEYPREVVQELKKLEDQYGSPVLGLQIMAPMKKFKLLDRNEDPVLLAKLEDGRYFFVAKWGTDLHWNRKLLVWPLRSFTTFFISLFVACVLISLLIPTDMIWNIKFYVALHLFIGLFGVCCFVGMTYNINFSDQDWNNKFFN